MIGHFLNLFIEPFKNLTQSTQFLRSEMIILGHICMQIIFIEV